MTKDGWCDAQSQNNWVIGCASQATFEMLIGGDPIIMAKAIRYYRA